MHEPSLVHTLRQGASVVLALVPKHGQGTHQQLDFSLQQRDLTKLVSVVLSSFSPHLVSACKVILAGFSCKDNLDFYLKLLLLAWPNHLVDTRPQIKHLCSPVATAVARLSDAQ